MKFKFPVFFFLTTILLSLVGAVRAQTLTSDKAYQDYQYNLTVYDTAFSDFQNAKNAYLDNQTLPLKETARQKLLIMLKDRDKLMSVYLTALRAKISESTGLSSDDKNNIFGKIDPEVNFYNNHITQYGDNDDLNTLFNKSGQSQSQYANTTSLIVKESLFDISLGQVEGLRIAQDQIYANLKSMIDTGVASGKLTRDPFSLWIADIDATDQILIQNEGTAKSQITQIYTQNYSFSGGYDSAISTLSSSANSLLLYNQYLTEVLNYIKSHE